MIKQVIKRFSDKKQQRKNSNSDIQILTNEGDEGDDGHCLLQSVNAKPSLTIFNRKQLRKQKKQEKKAKKDQYYRRAYQQTHEKQQNEQQNISSDTDKSNQIQKLISQDLNNIIVSNNNQINQKQKPLQNNSVKTKLEKNQIKQTQVQEVQDQVVDKQVKKMIMQREAKKSLQKLEQEINEDDQEIQTLEKKLKANKSDRFKKKLYNEVKQEWNGDDLLDFLDHISNVAKKNYDDSNYVPYDLKNQNKEYLMSDEEDQYEDDDQQQENEEERQENNNLYEVNLEKNDEEGDQNVNKIHKINRLEDSIDDEEEIQEKNQAESIDYPVKKPKQSLQIKSILKKQNDNEINYNKIQEQSSNQKQDIKNYQSIDQQKTLEIQKQFIRIMNRVSEGNIDTIFGQLVEIFQTNPKNEVGPNFSQVFIRFTVDPIKQQTHILSINVAIMSSLHQIFDNHLFQIFIKHLIERYNQLIQKFREKLNQSQDQNIQNDQKSQLNEQEEDSTYSQMKNMILTFTLLYVFDSVSILFLQGLIQELVQTVNESTLQLILLIIQYSGSKIRNENPLNLKEIIKILKVKMEAYKAEILQKDEQISTSKIDFLLLTLNDIKLNKKITSDHLHSLQFLINWVKKGIVKKYSDSHKQFTLDFQTTLNADKTLNKWWEGLGGLQLQNKPLSGENNQDFNIILPESDEIKTKLEKLAQKYRMVTQSRKQIFMLVMSSEDFIDATNKILRLKLNRNQQNDIAVVITECCMNEKTFNLYYCYLAEKLIELNSNLKFSFQYAQWDHYKQLDSFDLRKINNLAKFGAYLTSKKSLKISSLKFFNFEQIPKSHQLFLQIFLKDFFKEVQVNNLREMIFNARQNDQNLSFAETFKDYISQQFLPKYQQKKDQSQKVEDIQDQEKQIDPVVYLANLAINLLQPE